MGSGLRRHHRPHDRDGHALGNHTVNHPDLATLSATEVARQLDQNKVNVDDSLARSGLPALAFNLIRPPFGSENATVQNVMAPRGFDTLWNVTQGDRRTGSPGSGSAITRGRPPISPLDEAPPPTMTASTTTAAACRANIPTTRRTRPTRPRSPREINNVLQSSPVQRGDGIIVLIHDTHPTSRDSLAAIIHGLKARGYVFETIEDLRQRVYTHPEYGAHNSLVRFFETDQELQGRLRSFWIQNGELPVFGYPKEPASYQVSTDGNTYWSQWFERTRIELHPENLPPYDVLLGLLGRQRMEQALAGADVGIIQDLSALQAAMTPEDPAHAPGSDCQYFDVTRHWVCNTDGAVGFKAYWNHTGLRGLSSYASHLALFGYPLTLVYAARRPHDGAPILVQWFERARFEWHADNHDPYRVLLGLLGK